MLPYDTFERYLHKPDIIVLVIASFKVFECISATFMELGNINW